MTIYTTPPRVREIMMEWRGVISKEAKNMMEWRSVISKEAKKLIVPLKAWFEMKYDLITVGNGGVATSTLPITPVEPKQSNSKQPRIDKESNETITDIDMTPPTQEHTKEVRKNTKNIYRRGAHKAIREHLHRKYGGTRKEAAAMAKKFVASQVIWDAWSVSLEYWDQMKILCEHIDGVVNTSEEWMYSVKKKVNSG